MNSIYLGNDISPTRLFNQSDLKILHTSLRFSCTEIQGDVPSANMMKIIGTLCLHSGITEKDIVEVLDNICPYCNGLNCPDKDEPHGTSY